MTTVGHQRVSRQFEKLVNRLVYCPSCTTWRLPTARPSRPLHRTSLRASTLSSNTAINATKPIPQQFRALYEALAEVQKKASAQVNLSRLQLVLHGLESRSPTTRVAVLGLNVQETARRIVRLLLADALTPEARWEKDLLTPDETYSQGLVIRYGQTVNPNLPPARSSMPILYIPSSVLERTNIEILVSAIPTLSVARQPNTTTTSDTFLSPVLNTPSSADGRHVTISQPVHKSLLIAHDLQELVTIAGLIATASTSLEDRALISIVLDVSHAAVTDNRSWVDSGSGSANGLSTVMALDVNQAASGLEDIRRDLRQATSYEHKWIGAGMPVVSKWLTLASSSTGSSPETSLAPPIRSLISSVLDSAARNLASQRLATTEAAQSVILPAQTLMTLHNAVDAFSQSAHEELQSGLSSAWRSRNWKKLAWWKLFWRVDDVGLIVSDLITNSWLVKAERGVFEMQGRLRMAGVEPVGIDLAPPLVELQSATDQVSQGAIRMRQVTRVFAPEVPAPDISIASPSAAPGQSPRSSEPVLVNPTGHSVSVRLPVAPPDLASAISTARHAYLQSAINSLTWQAQTVVLNAVSITSLTAALSGLAYFSITSGSLYEAGTIVALGTTFAMYRMQGEWQKACQILEDGLYENGREVIKRVEEQMRRLVQDAATPKDDDIEIRIRQEAESAVHRAKVELNKLR